MQCYRLGGYCFLTVTPARLPNESPLTWVNYLGTGAICGLVECSENGMQSELRGRLVSGSLRRTLLPTDRRRIVHSKWTRATRRSDLSKEASRGEVGMLYRDVGSYRVAKYESATPDLSNELSL